MGADDDIYIVDTSSWLRIQEHPDGNRILDAMYRLVSSGRIKAPPEVFDELKQLNEASGWVKLHKSSILENRNADIEYLMLVGEVAHACQAMSAIRSAKNKADPYVVALAKHLSSNPGKCVVVADETLKSRPGRKLPSACGKFGIECVNVLELLQREFPNEGW